jgi:hypothetical protein
MIEDHGVDLLLLQESCVPEEHLPPLLYPDTRNQSVFEMVDQNGWGSVAFSKGGTLKPVPVSGFSGWVVGAEISGASWQDGSSDSMMALSVHAPSRNESYSKQVNKLLNQIKPCHAPTGRQARVPKIVDDFTVTKRLQSYARLSSSPPFHPTCWLYHAC